MSTSLCFNEIRFSPVNHDNQIWIRSSELARALGYKRSDILTKLYNKNADEFTSDMTQVIEIVENTEMVFSVKVRIFSLRGCHLIAMFARTPLAKSFRKWVLDVLDKVNETQTAALPPAPAQLTQSTADDRKPLRSIVNAWAKTVNVHQTTLWPQIRGHFNIDRIDHLPIEWIPDAIAYVEGKIDDYHHSKQIALPEQESLPYLSRRGKNRVQSTTELALKQMMIEANSLNVARDQFEDFFERLGKISGPINRQVAEAIRRTDDRVSTDSLLNTLSYQRWYARERVMDAIRAAHDACCSALVISRLMGV